MECFKKVSLFLMFIVTSGCIDLDSFDSGYDPYQYSEYIGSRDSLHIGQYTQEQIVREYSQSLIEFMSYGDRIHSNESKSDYLSRYSNLLSNLSVPMFDIRALDSVQNSSGEKLDSLCNSGFAFVSEIHDIGKTEANFVDYCHDYILEMDGEVDITYMRAENEYLIAHANRLKVKYDNVNYHLVEAAYDYNYHYTPRNDEFGDVLLTNLTGKVFINGAERHILIGKICIEGETCVFQELVESAQGKQYLYTDALISENSEGITIKAKIYSDKFGYGDFLFRNVTFCEGMKSIESGFFVFDHEAGFSYQLNNSCNDES